MISIIRRAGVSYPDDRDGFAPHERYPEYRFRTTASAENSVYAMVRDTLLQAGLDPARAGTPDWNPLGRWIRRGDRVFVLCNFVHHRRPQESPRAFKAKVVHGSVLRALVDYVLLAVGDGGRVMFGNAPLQSCRWTDVLADSGAAAVLAFYRDVRSPVDAVDLRGEVTDRDAFGRVRNREVRGAETPIVEVDLGEDSLLDAYAGSGEPRFRVSDYDPQRTGGFHRRGSHRYVMHRAVLESDVIVSLPKLKTHEKVGITCAVKGFVGAVARKDCLAHHRFGSPAGGGDEYPRRLGFLAPSSRFHDWVTRRKDDAPGQAVSQILDRSVRRILRRLGLPGAGAWYGNDTAWRMAVDLARIVHYADAGGTLQSTPQRRQLVLIDGIIAGEGDGPLAPIPVDAATILFADGVLDADRAACRLMGFDPVDIPTVREGARGARWPLGDPQGSPTTILDARSIPSETVPSALGRPFRPPIGWRGHLGRSS